ncbi:MAG TPA: hypothetical protein DCX21_01830 [Eubacterium sp.]|nr:hypothetical protein [Eubacterium sp.]
MAKIIKLPKKKKANIRFIYFILALWTVYVIVFGITYLTRKKVTIYEVKPGSISENSTYIAIIQRSEELVTTPYSGQCNFLVSEGERVTIGDNVVCYDNSGELTSYINSFNESSNELSKEDYKAIAKEFNEFKKAYNSKDFANGNLLVADINSNIKAYMSKNSLNKLNEYTRSISSGFNTVKSEKTGIITFHYDGLENMNFDELKFSDFPDTVKPMNNIENYSQVSSNSTAYRIVTSQKWNMYIKLSDQDAKNLADKSTVKVYFKKNNLTMNSAFEIVNTKYGLYGKFSFNRLMSDFINDRYVEIEIDKSVNEGLKIPKTALVKKSFYVIPKDVAFEYNGKMSVSVRRKDSKGELKDLVIDLNIIAEDDDNYYITDLDFYKDDMINTKINSKYYGSDFLTLSETKEFEGVYWVNNGYVIFKRVEIFDSNDEYYIIKSNTKYGISKYDNIIYDSHTVKEDEILY